MGTKKQRNLSQDAKLKFTDYFGFCCGAGIMLPAYVANGFLLIFYSNVLGITLLEVSTVIAVSKVFDGISDILMGRIVDKTKSKYGKARPWYIRMILPTVVSLFLLFWMPPSVMSNKIATIVYVFFTYNLFTTVCVTAMQIPHSSMIGLMTLNPKSRGIVGVISMVANSVCLLIVSNLFLRLAKFFGGGDQYTQKGFSIAVLLMCVIYAIMVTVGFFLTRERVTGVTVEEANKSAEDNTESKDNIAPADASFWQALKSLVTNKYWILCLVMCLGFFFLMSFSGQITLYFSQYILNDTDFYGYLTTALYLMVIVGIGISIPVMTKLGKRNTLAPGMIVAAVGWLIPLAALNKGGAVAGAVCVGLGFGLIAGPAGSFLQDTLTYGIWKSGIYAIGMGNSVFSFVNKLSSALGTVVLGWSLDAVNFVGTAEVQPTAVLSVIKILYTVIPALICVICFVLCWFYNLDKKLPEISEEVKEGKIGENRTKDLMK